MSKLLPNKFLRTNETPNMTPRSPTTIEEALKTFWKQKGDPHHLPDYAGFHIWIDEQFQELRETAAVPLHAKTATGSEFFYELVYLAQEFGIEITNDKVKLVEGVFGEPKKGMSRLKALNKSKLLLSYLRDLPPRQRALLVNLSSLFSNEGDSKGASEAAAQSKYRADFFVAIEKSDGYSATKSLGRLREEEHDDGEVAFLEATLLFHLNEPTKAIECAQLVSKNHVDWPQAHMLALECYALAGAWENALDLAYLGEFTKYPQHFIEYVGMLCVLNSAVPEITRKRAIATIRKTKSKGWINKKAQVYALWNQLSCEIATRFVELAQDAILSEEAARQAGSLEGEEAEDFDWKNSDLAPQRLYQAIQLDKRFDAIINETWPPDDAYQLVVSELINYEGSQPRDWLQALRAMWRIGDKQVYVDNVLSNIESLRTFPRSLGTIEILQSAAVEAIISGRTEEASKLETVLGQDFEQATISDQKFDVREEKIVRGLSAMGKVAFSAASSDLTSANSENNSTRDAGMISLGFYRILELEVNSKLLSTSVLTTDVENLDKTHMNLENSAKSNREKKTLKTWTMLIPALRRLADEGKGLELGSLETLLGKARSVGGYDAELKEMVRQNILSKLTTTGKMAFQSGELQQLISTETRERYRNPPAHTRYLNLATARECKEHVVQSLEKLGEYCHQPNFKSRTLH